MRKQLGLQILCAFCLAFLTQGLRAQMEIIETPRPAYGVYGDANFLYHTADFRAIPGFPNCCPVFTNGTGFGPSFGVLYNAPLAEKLSLDLRLGYTAYGATLAFNESTTIIDPTGTPVTGAFDHTIVAKLASVGLEPILAYNLLGNLALRVGGNIGYVVTSSFSQKEVVAQPDNGIFTDTKTRTRNQFDNVQITNASTINSFVLGGLSYTLPLNSSGSLHALPEIYYMWGLTNITKDLSWKANGLIAGVAVEYSPLPAAPPRDTTPPPPPPIAVKKKAELSVSLAALTVDENGKEDSRVQLKVEEFLASRLRPLLNYVFFDEGSSTLPDRYTRLTPEEVQGFRVEKLYNYETLPTYYHLLNIIGRRLIENPESKITIIGCNSDEGKERGKKDLSKARAVTVHDYFRAVWNIADDRMRVEARNLPEKPSFVKDTDGIVENRRAEIYSDDWNIVQPVFTRDTIRKVTPGILRFHPSVKSEAGIENWTLAISQDGKMMKEISGSGSVPPTVDWDLAQNVEQLRQNTSPLSYKLRVTDHEGNALATESGSVPLDQQTVEKKRSERIKDKEVDRYSLILFDFDRAELGTSNKRISEYIREHSAQDATVSITGYTDRMGDDEHNQHLSEARANETAKLLKLRTTDVKGVGEKELLFDNNIPEGRFYCRTVNIEVETPVKE
jgi:outer membrane protein OmpA-like peptidoglycan-associated protein